MQTDCFPNATPDWPKRQISALAQVNPRYPVDKDSEHPFVEMASVGEAFGGVTFFDRRRADASGLSRFKAGDTLFAKITPCPQNGKVAFVGDLGEAVGLGSTEFIVLSPREHTDERFLFHLLCSHDVRGRAVARMEGSTGRQRVPEEVFTRRLLVPIPPLHEQRSIAAVLDAVETLLRRIRAARHRVEASERSISQDLLSQIDLQRSTVGREFSIQNGVTLNEARRLDGDPHPYLRVANVYRDAINLDDVLTVRVTQGELQPRRLAAGDLLIVEGHANRAEIGRCGLVDEGATGMTFQNHLFRLRTNGRILPGFAWLWLNSDYARRYWDARCGTSSGLNTINQRSLKQLAIPVPDARWQATVVGIISALRRQRGALDSQANTLEHAQAALQRDLLSGRVRAPDRARLVPA